MKTVVMLIIGLCLVKNISGLYYNYYWRDYNGDIPSDAIEGGHDGDYRKTYIAQSMALHGGKYATLPGELISSQEETLFPLNGVPCPQRQIVKVLAATPPTSARWIPTTSTSFLFDTMQKHLISGGLESNVDSSNSSKLFIGRTTEGSHLIVGKILLTGNRAQFQYVYQNRVKTATSFEALFFDN